MAKYGIKDSTGIKETEMQKGEQAEVRVLDEL